MADPHLCRYSVEGMKIIEHSWTLFACTAKFWLVIWHIQADCSSFILCGLAFRATQLVQYACLVECVLTFTDWCVVLTKVELLVKLHHPGTCGVGCFQYQLCHAQSTQSGIRLATRS